MTLPIYLSDPSGAGMRSESTHDFITKNMHDTVSNAIHAAGFTTAKHAAPDMADRPASMEGYGGLVLFGGFDIDSSFYKSGYSRRVSRSDAYELDLIFAALKAGLPIFGICRGMQLINVAFGGTLHSDIGHLTNVKHNNFGAGAYEHQAVAHAVEVAGSSVLKDGIHTVASSHHQAVHMLGAGLVVTAWGTEDGIVEMIEAPQLNVIGTQWHPESAHVQQDDTLTPILADFLGKARDYDSTRAVEGLPAHLSAESLRGRFPVKSSVQESGSYRYAPRYLPMWQDDLDDIPGVSRVKRDTWYLDEDDPELIDIAQAELDDDWKAYEDDEFERELAMQRIRDSWV